MTETPMAYFVDQARAALEPVVVNFASMMREHDELQARISQYRVRDNLLAAEEDRHEGTKREFAECVRVLNGLLTLIKGIDPKLLVLRCPDCNGRLGVDDHVPGCPLDVLFTKYVSNAVKAAATS